jgi:hypothetical protein
MAGHLVEEPKYLEETAGARAAETPAGLDRALTLNPSHALSVGQRLPDCQRLLVLVPNAEIVPDSQLSQRIWQLASPGRVPVLYIAIAGDYESEMTARRRLSLLAAITRDKWVRVETQIVHASQWAAALKGIEQPGDLLLAHAEQRVSKGWFGSEPLSEQLRRGLAAPIYTLSGYCQDRVGGLIQPLHIALSAILLGLILIGFFALDAQVIDQLQGAPQQVMLLILLLVEIGAVWVWNGWAG